MVAVANSPLAVQVAVAVAAGEAALGGGAARREGVVNSPLAVLVAAVAVDTAGSRPAVTEAREGSSMRAASSQLMRWARPR